MEILIKNQEFLIYLGLIMIVTGILKERGYLSDIFTLLLRKIKSKKIVLLLISMFGGILPIPGRVAVSASILNSIAPSDPERRKKYGIIDYLSTHHYYLWSPLEKTVIIPMAVLGLSYGELVSYTLPLLLISIIYLIFHIIRFKNDNIEIDTDHQVNFKNIYRVFVPFILTIILCGVTDRYLPLFASFTLYLVSLSKSWGGLSKHINWKLMFMVGVVIIVSNIIGLYHIELTEYLKGLTDNTSVFLIGVLCFLLSFLLGSSGKYAGVVAIITTILGMEYFLFIFTMCYAGYLISPTHKCIFIGKEYFGTPVKMYFKSIIIWIGLLILYGVLDLTF